MSMGGQVLKVGTMAGFGGGGVWTDAEGTRMICSLMQLEIIKVKRQGLVAELVVPRGFIRKKSKGTRGGK